MQTIKRFAVLNSDGVLIGCSSMGDVEISDDIVMSSHVHYRYTNGEFVPYERKKVVLPFNEARLDAYPPIGQQLDALWHAMDDGLIPKVPDFYDPIKAVKDAIPKP